MQCLWVEDYHAGFGTRYDVNPLDLLLCTYIVRVILNKAYNGNYKAEYGTEAPGTNLGMLETVTIIHLRLAMMLADIGHPDALHSVYRGLKAAKDPVAKADAIDACMAYEIRPYDGTYLRAQHPREITIQRTSVAGIPYPRRPKPGALREYTASPHVLITEPDTHVETWLIAQNHWTPPETWNPAEPFPHQMTGSYNVWELAAAQI